VPAFDLSRPVVALEAGGAETRLLIAGRPPVQLAEPDSAHFERVVRVGWPGQQALLTADPARLPFVEAMFDRALMTSHLPRAQARTDLRELWRVLSPAALALLVIKARRPWQFRGWQPVGWTQRDLEQALDDAMFVTHDWQVATLPKRWHLVLVGKRDGLKPAVAGHAETVAVVATNLGCVAVAPDANNGA
jgi:hypothetical protein